MRAPFPERYERAIGDFDIRRGLGSFQSAWRVSRDAAIADLEHHSGHTFESLRRDLAESKRQTRHDGGATLDQFVRNAEAAGAHVICAATIDDATTAVVDISRRHGATLMVKGKSMVSEELDLNEVLDNHGITTVETDLGEWLLQLDHDQASHLVMPIIHRRRHQIAAILERSLQRPFDPDDIPTMVLAARQELRAHFVEAGIGLSGANALIASTGSVMLVTNEGNTGLAISLPPVHVVVVGIDKLVADTSVALAQLRLLGRSATGQTLTTYTTFISGPSDHQSQYIVMVDNGRSDMAADPVFESALGCIRCGACANVCPPYAIVGGHAFGHVYTGAIGLVNTGFHHGLEAIAGPQSLCVSCGACTAICPVEIPLASQILEVRSRIATTPAGGSRLRRAVLRLFARRRLFDATMMLAAVLGAPLRRSGHLRLHHPRRHLSWRLLPALPIRSARSRIASRTGTGDDAPRISLMIQCLTDRVAPDIAVAATSLIERCGFAVDVPPDQHCCGLPALDSGERDLAVMMAKRTIEAFEGTSLVVTPAASCAIAVLHDYPALFGDEPEWAERARRLAARTRDLVTFLSEELPPGRSGEAPDERVVAHHFCQSTNVARLGDLMDRVIADATGVPVVPLRNADTCCGFGGSTSLSAPEVAQAILAKKLLDIEAADADVVVTDNPGCVVHIRAGVAARGTSGPRVQHVAEHLADRLGD